MKIIVAIIIIYSQLAMSASNWSEHYKIVQKDIRTVEALKTKDLALMVRLFELYGEKLTLIIEKEKDIEIKYLDNGNKNELNKIRAILKNTLNKLETISKKIERQTKNKKILAKIYYYRGLNYYMIKKYKLFYINMKKAERLNESKKMAELINTKLADYHYNEKHYKSAVKYYKRLLADEKNGWITKFYYNLAWSQVKLNLFNDSLVSLKRAYMFEKKKGYYQVGYQLVDSLMLFHAYAMKSVDGYKYLKQNKLDTFDNMIKYLHYVFEHGQKKNAQYIIDKIEQMKLTPEMRFKLLEKEIIVYRATKKFSRLQTEFKNFQKKIKTMNMSSVSVETKSALVNGVRSYTGYLQELVKSKNLINKKYKRKYVRYVAYNFNLLKQLERSRALEYSFFEGETYFSLEDYKRASFVYAKGIKTYRKSKNKKEEAYLVKSFDSLFKSLEKQKKPSAHVLLFSYNSYLSFYPKNLKSKLIYQRLTNYYQAKSNYPKMFQVLKRYNKAFPEDIKIQKSYYATTLNKYIDKKDIQGLNDLKKLVVNNFLRFTKAEVSKLSLVIKQIHFSKYDDMAKNGKLDEALSGFDELFNDEKAKPELRVDAIRKKMFYLHRYQKYKKLGNTIVLANKYYDLKQTSKNKKETLFFAQDICLGNEEKTCVEVLDYLVSKKSFKLPVSLDNIFFKLQIISGDDYKSVYSKANTNQRRNFLFKNLMIDYPGFSHPLFEIFYKEVTFRRIIDAEVERTFFQSFYKSLSFKDFENYLEKVSVKSISSTYTKRIQSLRNNFAVSSFKLLDPPKVENYTPEIFGGFANKLTQDTGAIIKKIDGALRRTEPNFVPYYLSVITNNFESEVSNFKKFIPVSNIPELEKAMNDEVQNFHKFFDQKLIEYKTLYYQSIDRTSIDSGARKYREALIQKPVNYGVRSERLWLD